MRRDGVDAICAQFANVTGLRKTGPDFAMALRSRTN